MTGEDIGRDDAATNRRDHADDLCGLQLVFEGALVIVELAAHLLVFIDALEVAGIARHVVCLRAFGDGVPDFLLALCRLRLLAHVRHGHRAGHQSRTAAAESRVAAAHVVSATATADRSVATGSARGDTSA